jgi:hypothetical protein
MKYDDSIEMALGGMVYIPNQGWFGHGGCCWRAGEINIQTAR